MSILFFYDTETTGLPEFKDPSNAPHQPHIVQAYGALVDSATRVIVQEANLIVAPDGWVIPQEVIDIHGITIETAKQIGLDESLVTEVMLDLWRAADKRIGHNQSFDARIMRIALKRFATEDAAEEWKAGPAECTAVMARPHCDNKGKFPSLQDAYSKFVGGEIQGAHNARNDTHACIALYWAMKDAGY